jgi:hypothetical protein
MRPRNELQRVRLETKLNSAICFWPVSLFGSSENRNRLSNLKALELVLLLSLAFDIWKIILTYLFSGSSLTAMN